MRDGNDSRESLARLGDAVPGPPWILGARGAARAAPENTAAALARAFELGLDGVAYEVRACATGELFLLADAALERTTDGSGRIGERTLPELTQLDAGGWFDARFAGEPLALVEEALALPEAQSSRTTSGAVPMHVVLLEERGALGALVRAIELAAPARSIRVATRERDTLLEVRDTGLAPLFVADSEALHGGDDDLARFLLRERIGACALPLAAWARLTTSTRWRSWSGERWALDLEDPSDVARACRMPLFAFTTREPERALAARALAHFEVADAARDADLARWPLQVAALDVTWESAPRPDPRGAASGKPTFGAWTGQWAGRWNPSARLHNPFGFDVAVVLDVVVRRGAFETKGLPVALRLAPGEHADVPFQISGGSWTPGGDPLLFAHFQSAAGPGRAGARLSIDAPLVRRRTLRLGQETRRVELLRERPGEALATMTLRRRGGLLLAAIEGPGGLADARALLFLDGREHYGARGVRAALPDDFDHRDGGVPFSVGLLGREPAGARRLRLRRWAGGLPRNGDHGAPGVLLP